MLAPHGQGQKRGEMRNARKGGIAQILLPKFPFYSLVSLPIFSSLKNRIKKIIIIQKYKNKKYISKLKIVFRFYSLIKFDKF